MHKWNILVEIYSWKIKFGRTGHTRMDRTGRSNLMIEDLMMPSRLQWFWIVFRLCENEHHCKFKATRK